MSAGPETRLVERITEAIKAKWPAAWAVKVHGGPYQTVGIPDLLVVVEGRLTGLEVKAQRLGESEEHARNRATPTQLATIAAIRRAGGVAGVVLTVEESIELVQTALRGTLT